jgi:hypothetical protein
MTRAHAAAEKNTKSAADDKFRCHVAMNAATQPETEIRQRQGSLCQLPDRWRLLPFIAISVSSACDNTLVATGAWQFCILSGL